MSSDRQALMQLLEGLEARFTALMDLLARERQAIRQRQWEQVQELTHVITGAIDAIREDDHRCQEVVERLARGLGQEDGVITLAELDQAWGGKTGLQELRKRLRTAMERAERANRENRAALEGVKAATDAIMQLLQGGKRDVAYDRHGQRQSYDKLSLFSKSL